MPRALISIVIAAVLIASCASDTVEGPLPEAPPVVTVDELTAMVEASGTPAVVNVWASWCLPCRSEAPLIEAASQAYQDVLFVGLDVRDDTGDARRFIASHLADADMTHASDPSGNVPIELGGTNGVPITFFYRADGSLAHRHLGIIDEPTLARYLDEISG